MLNEPDVDGQSEAATVERVEGRDEQADRSTWTEYQFRAMEKVLQAGYLDRVEGMLRDRATDAIVALADPAHNRRLQALREGLAEAKVREAVGGPGSLIDSDHYVTKILEDHRRALEAFAARSQDVRCRVASSD